MDETTKKYISDVIEEQFKCLEAKLVANIKKYIDRELANKLSTGPTEASSDIPDNMALMKVTSELIDKKLNESLRTKIIPRINKLDQYVRYKTVDGTELVTEFRKSVMNDSVKQITGGDSYQDFLTDHFAFDDQ